MRNKSGLLSCVKLLALAALITLAVILARRFAWSQASQRDSLALAALGATALLSLCVGGTGRRMVRVGVRTGAGETRRSKAAEGFATDLQDKLRFLEIRNAELEQAWRQAEARVEIRSRLLAQMSHEMRTPMNGIIGFADLLAKTPLEEYQTEKLRLIERSAKSLLDIINEILDLAKIEAEQFALRPELFPLRPYLEDTVALLSGRAKVPVLLCVEPTVPESMYGDPLRLQQVLSNLLGNAVKFTHTGRIVVRVRCHPRADRLLISVSDTGRGIPAESLGQLFTPFYQLGEWAPNGERGSGLGLYIAMTLVERMGGGIGVVSKPGKGSTFWFAHPLTESKAARKPRLPGRRLAVIDTDPLSRKSLRYQLEDLGATAYCFSSLEEFGANYDPSCHGTMVLINAGCAAKSGSLPLTIERAKAAGGRPVLLLPYSSRSIHEYCQTKGVAYLWCPARSDALSDLLAESPAPPPIRTGIEAGPTALAGKHFLVVDDNEINRRLLEARLTRLGAHVVEAPNGTKALVRLRTRRFDLVFMDLRMPGMNGLDILRELLLGEFSPNHSTPFVAVTAYLDDEQKISIAQAGFADVLLKPVLDEPLLLVLEKYLDIGPLIRRPLEPVSEPFCGYAAIFLEKSSGNRSLAQTLARKLARELEEQSRDVRQAIKEGDFERARDSAHQINGSAAFCGLRGIRSSADALEHDLMQTVPPASLGQHAHQLDQEITRFLKDRDSLLISLGATESGLSY